VLINREAKKIVRISLFPCSCQCDEKIPDTIIKQFKAAQGGCFKIVDGEPVPIRCP
jgi:hypothetical protein